MFEIRITPIHVLNLAERELEKQGYFEPYYCQQKGKAYAEWLNMRNILATRLQLEMTLSGMMP